MDCNVTCDLGNVYSSDNRPKAEFIAICRNLRRWSHTDRWASLWTALL